MSRCEWEAHLPHVRAPSAHGKDMYPFSFKDLLSTCSEKGGKHKSLEPKNPCGLGQALAPLGNEEHACVKSRGSFDYSTGWMPCTVSPLVGKWACWWIFQWVLLCRSDLQVYSQQSLSPTYPSSQGNGLFLLWSSSHHSITCYPQLMVAFIAHQKASFCGWWRPSWRSIKGQHEENKM